MLSIVATTLGFIYSTEDLAQSYYRPLQVAHYKVLLQNFYRDGSGDQQIESVFESYILPPVIEANALLISDDVGNVLYGKQAFGNRVDLTAYSAKYPIVISLKKHLWLIYPHSSIYQFGNLVITGKFTWIIALILLVLLISAYFGVRVAFQFENLMQRESDESDQGDIRREDALSREVIRYMSAIRQDNLTTTEHIDKLKQFNATIAHELRNQLNTISVAVELLQYSKEGASDKTIAILMNEIKHINRLVNDLHLLSLIEVQKLAITPHPMPLPAVLEYIVDAARSRSAPRELEYVISPDAVDVGAYIDEERFRQAIDNLVDNAVRHSNGNYPVRIGLNRSVDECVITVQDEGTGIPPEEIDYLFHRFYRASNARGKGSGLGLAIVQEIIESHCGSIRVHSTLEVGTTFEIRLPLAKIAS